MGSVCVYIGTFIDIYANNRDKKCYMIWLVEGGWKGIVNSDQVYLQNSCSKVQTNVIRKYFFKNSRKIGSERSHPLHLFSSSLSTHIPNIDVIYGREMRKHTHKHVKGILKLCSVCTFCGNEGKKVYNSYDIFKYCKNVRSNDVWRSFVRFMFTPKVFFGEFPSSALSLFEIISSAAIEWITGVLLLTPKCVCLHEKIADVWEGKSAGKIW